MTSVRAIVVDPQAAGGFGVTDVDAPHPGPGEALVQVEASSLNRGDLLAAEQADAGWRPGHDVA
jgi:NADPH:quinone reductase